MMRKLLVILGVPVDNLTMDEALERCDEFVATGRATGKTHQIATVNADFVVNSLHDPELRRILQEADMSTADGMPLVWASRLLGGPLPGRVTGADMVPALARRAAEKGYSIYFLGARPGVAARAAEILQERHPGLKVAGVYSPPPASVLEMDRAVADQVIAARPDILLVAFGNPKQEKWIRMYAPELRVPICIGVGGTLDMIVGVTKRAPAWMQRTGLEWVYRMAQEPRRLFKRYMHDFGYFGYFFVRQWWAMRRGATPAPAAEPEPEAPPAPPAPPQPAEPAEGGLMVLRPSGRIDVHNQAELVAEASRLVDRSPYLVISMAAVEFLDSSALGGLVGLANRARAAGGALWLAEVPRHIADLLALVRLDRFFELVADPAAAEALWRAAPAQEAPQPGPGSWTVVRTPRMFDSATAPVLLDRCLASLEERPLLTLDLSETSFLASAGMAAMMRLDRAARERGGALRLAGCGPDVMRTLKLVRLDTILTIFPDVASATATTPALARMPALPAVSTL